VPENWKMENREGTRLFSRRCLAQRFSNFYFLFSIFFLSAGCGAPGDPRPPIPIVPVAVSDLSARQDGDGVQLSFTLPSKSISGERLSPPPAVEILRGILKPDGAADAKSFRVVDTIPGALIDNYRFDDHVHFTDPIAPEETKTHRGTAVAYLVRTRASQKRASADSNVVSVRVFPVPERIASVDARLTESAVELSWAAPTHTSAGDSLSALTGYRVYRSEVNPTSASSSTQALSQGKSGSLSAPLAKSEANSYSDISFSFDRTYTYTVRSVVEVEGKELESSDSQPLTVTPRDTFPPAAPQGLVAAVLPGPTQGTSAVELSWSINLETDLAGYRVYRSEQENVRGQMLNADLLLAPADRDTSVQPGHRYWYTVIAVDRAGNESTPSAPVAIDVPQPSQ
jgi:fibronectin type 3 domain-containing protein